MMAKITADKILRSIIGAYMEEDEGGYSYTYK